MIGSRRIGNATITNVVEYYGPTHDPFGLYPDLTEATLARHRGWLAPDHFAPANGRLVVAIQLWIVRIGESVIVIDTGVGNRKPRTVARMDHLNSLVPEWFAAAGVSFSDVTHVVMTHLHGDHVGWNTVRAGEDWVPAFPNARYLLPEADLRHFADLYATDPGPNIAFADSVQPILDRDLVDFIDDGSTVADALAVRAAPGHTPGMVSLWLPGDAGVFCADVFHTPLQIAEPDLNTAYCVQPEMARATRRALLERVADTPTLVMPCHFGPPFCGRVARRDESFAFLPEPAAERLR